MSTWNETYISTYLVKSLIFFLFTWCWYATHAIDLFGFSFFYSLFVFCCPLDGSALPQINLN